MRDGTVLSIGNELIIVSSAVSWDRFLDCNDCINNCVSSVFKYVYVYKISMNKFFTIVCARVYSCAHARFCYCKPSKWPNTARMSLNSRITTKTQYVIMRQSSGLSLNAI